MDNDLFINDPRSYALELLYAGVNAEMLLSAALNYMSNDDVRNMLDMNELSPRFDETLEAEHDD